MRWIQPTPDTTVPVLADGLGYSTATWDRPEFLAKGHLSSSERMPTAVLTPDRAAMGLPVGDLLDLESFVFEDPLLGRPMSASQFFDRRLYNDALLVWHRGAVIHESYRNGMIDTDRHVNHSTSKTLTTMMIGIAVADGRLDASEPIRTYVHALRAMRAWDAITVQHVLDMASGIDADERYDDPDAMFARYARAVGYYPGAVGDAVGALAFIERELSDSREPPGRTFDYLSYLTDLLPMMLSEVYGQHPCELYEQHLFRPVGPEFDCHVNCDSTGLPIVEGQLNLTLRDFTRWALPMLGGGRNLVGEQVIPAAWVDESYLHSAERRQAFVRSADSAMFVEGEYHNQIWQVNPASGRIAMLGIHGQFAYLDRPNDLAIIGFGSYPTPASTLMDRCLQQLWMRITDAVGG
jgi:CubicO group peptidase (beta-lactamase class C family)